MFTYLAVLAAWLRSKGESDRGAALVEYALLVAFVAMVCVGTLLLLGNRIAERLSHTAGSMP